MLPLVGGPQHGGVLLPLLEQLASMEETVVRDRVCFVGVMLWRQGWDGAS